MHKASFDLRGLIWRAYLLRAPSPSELALVGQLSEQDRVQPVDLVVRVRRVGRLALALSGAGELGHDRVECSGLFDATCAGQADSSLSAVLHLCTASGTRWSWLGRWREGVGFLPAGAEFDGTLRGSVREVRLTLRVDYRDALERLLGRC